LRTSATRDADCADNFAVYHKRITATRGDKGIAEGRQISVELKTEMKAGDSPNASASTIKSLIDVRLEFHHKRRRPLAPLPSLSLAAAPAPR